MNVFVHNVFIANFRGKNWLFYSAAINGFIYNGCIVFSVRNYLKFCKYYLPKTQIMAAMHSKRKFYLL
jgi:hypothetical protein